MEPHIFLTQDTKVVLNISQIKKYKNFRENVSKQLHDLGIRRKFLDRMPKALANRKKMTTYISSRLTSGHQKTAE